MRVHRTRLSAKLSISIRHWQKLFRARSRTLHDAESLIVADIDADLAAFTKARYRTRHGAILPRCCVVRISLCWYQREQRNTADHREYRSIEKYCAMANMIPQQSSNDAGHEPKQADRGIVPANSAGAQVL